MNETLKYLEKTKKNIINIRNNEDIKERKRSKIAFYRAKKSLSNEYESIINLEKKLEEEDFQIRISRAGFEILCDNKLELIKGPIDRALKDKEQKKENIEEVILVSGSIRITKIEKIIKE